MIVQAKQDLLGFDFANNVYPGSARVMGNASHQEEFIAISWKQATFFSCVILRDSSLSIFTEVQGLAEHGKRHTQLYV